MAFLSDKKNNINSIVILPKVKLSEAELKIISYIISNINNFCKFNKSEKIKVIPQLSFTKKLSPEYDYLEQINIKSLLRLLPGTYLKKPFDAMKRIITYHEFGFIISLHNIYNLKDSIDLDSFDSLKYHYFIPKDLDKKNDPYIVWLELGCVDPNFRGNELLFNLLNELKKTIKKETIENKYTFAILCLDISGTKNGWRNQNLREFYQKLGFEFNQDFHLYTYGAQLGYLIIE